VGTILGPDGGALHFIAMDFVGGKNLAESSGLLTPEERLEVLRTVARAVAFAHEQGIVHRDLKPENILIEPATRVESSGLRWRVLLTDFGLAKILGGEDLTRSGTVIGTPHYMSPEQVQGKQLDSKSDVYSIGILLYEMLAGEKPFIAPSLTAILTAHITEKPKPLIDVRPDVGKQINDIIMRCLAKDPKDRYADAGALLHDLDQVQVAPAAAA
jgi:serine/threonine protein kinase